MIDVNNEFSLEEFLNFFPYPDRLNAFLEESKSHSENKFYLSRILSWLELFSNQYMETRSVHFDCTVQSFFELWINNDILQSQTQIEFELSKKFYASNFSFKKGTVVIDLDAAKTVLVLCFWFSRYHGMLRKSLSKAIDSSKTTVKGIFLEHHYLIYVMETCFVQYETPHFLLNNCHNMNTIDTDKFMKLICSRKGRARIQLDIALTKYQFYQLTRINGVSEYDNAIIYRANIMAALLSKGISDEFIDAFTNASATFRNNPNKFFSKIEIWKCAYQIVASESIQEVDKNGFHRKDYVIDIVDYLEFMIYHSNQPFSLKGRTFQSLNKLSRDWHDINRLKALDEFRHLKWNKSTIKDVSFHHEGEKYSAIELNSGESLYQEGLAQQHCVASYTPNCVDGNSIIFSIRKEELQNENQHTIATVEVRNEIVVQARGFKNKPLNENALNILEAWSYKSGVSIE